MAKREDGRETRQRLLNAACAVFAERGYPNAKVAEICRRASANVASVNYYFGSKASLYTETWRYIFQQFKDDVFTSLTDGPPEERLRSYIQALMKNVIRKEEVGLFSRLYLREMANPTGLIKEDWRELIAPIRRTLHNIIHEIIGKKVHRQQVLFCELSIISQCRTLMTVKRSDLEYLLEDPLDPALIARLADHIADFSLAGIRAVDGGGGRRSDVGSQKAEVGGRCQVSGNKITNLKHQMTNKSKFQ